MNLREMAESARTYTRHDMIDAFSELPPYPENRARLLYWFLARAGNRHKPDILALAVSLAQYGLETHDLVQEPLREESLRHVRRRQLQVLAGDYFNGRFYQLLARTGGLETVRLVSRAICEVNRLKAVLHEKWQSFRLTAEEYLDHLVLIRSELFMPLVAFMPSREAETFPALFRSLVRCEVLSDELRAVGTGDKRYGYAFWHLLDHANPLEREALLHEQDGLMPAFSGKYKVSGLLEQMLEAQQQKVRKLAESFDSPTLMEEIIRLLDTLSVRVPAIKTAEDY